ncbi:9336_t:CDS:2, partial [Funneliformis caledonium]
YDIRLTLDIINGKREKIIDGTPLEYSFIYQKCWKFEPSDRPNIQEIVSTLKSMTSLKQETGDDFISTYKEIDNSPINKESTSGMVDDYDLDNIPNVDHFKNIGSESNSDLQQSNTIFYKKVLPN